MLDYQIGYGYSALDAQARRDKLDGYAVVSGLGVSVDSGLTLSVASGEATVGESGGSVDTVSLGSATTVTLNAADSTHPRKDTIYIDTSGTVQVETGTANAADPTGNERFATYEPAPPLPSSDGTVLAEVWVGPGATSLAAADVRDRRAPADVVGERGVFDSLEAEKEVVNHGIVRGRNEERIDASKFDGADADARLDNALAAASTGDLVLLEDGTYSANRTVTANVRLSGTAPWGDPSAGSTLDGDWTFDASVTMTGVNIGTGSVQVNTRSVIKESYCNNNSASIAADTDRCIISQVRGADITLTSNSSLCVVDSCSDVSVTDNGSGNVVGDIA